MSDFTSGTLTATATAPSGIANSASQLILYTTGCGGAAFTVSNAAGTVGFWASADGGANWTAMGVSPANGSTAVTTASTAGLWQVNCSAYTHVGLVATAITGGSINASIHTSPVSAFESGGGGGPGGMNPPGSTGIVSSLFTTTGASGASTYNPSTGAMNIPIYAPGTINYASYAVTSSITVTATTVASTGFGTTAPFTVLFNPFVLVYFNWNIQATGSATQPSFFPIYRTTGTIPPNAAAIGGTDVELIRPRIGGISANAATSVSGTFIDTSPVVGTPYRYYLGCYSGGASTVTIVAAPVGTVSLQVVEMK